MVFGRRVRVLAQHLAEMLPPQPRVLDVGCGDGAIDCLIAQQLPGATIEGIDVLVRPEARIPVKPFDGLHIPFADASFDAVMLIDVLHHASEPIALLREAARVGKTVLIKDHLREGLFAVATLRFMDWVGNAPHGVRLPYNYWSASQWEEALRALSLKRSETKHVLGLYPPPASWIFERNLHFVGRFERAPHDASLN
jgi:SAM-dependent methyltransferase